MAAIANLAVSVTARVGKFVKGMKRAGKRLKKFSLSVAASAKRVAKFGFALGAVAAAGLILLTKKAFTSIDAMAKLSDAIGVTTTNLAALQHAGEITGVSTEAMNKSLAKFVIRIGEAQTGVGEGAIAFKALGLAAKDVADVGVFKAFIRTAEAINKLPNASTKAEASYRLFGRQGIALVNTLAVGRKGLEDFRKEAIALGLAMDREAARKVEAANDAITRLTEVATGLGRTIAVVTAPFVIVLANDLQTLAMQSRATGNAIVRGMRWGVAALGAMFDAVQKVKRVWFLFTAAVQMSGLAIVKTVGNTIRASATIISTTAIAIFQKVETWGESHLMPAVRGWLKAIGILAKQAVSIADSVTEGLPSFAGVIAAFQEEIDASLKSAAEALEQFSVTPMSARMLKWFDDAIERAEELAKIMGARPDPLTVPAIAGRPRGGLRPLTQLGGSAGARAVARAQSAESKQLTELQQINSTLKTISKQKRGLRP